MAQSSDPLAKYPFYKDSTKLLITRGDEVVDTLPCQRMALDTQPEPYTSRHTHGHIGRISDGTIYAAIGNESTVLLASTDEGLTWTHVNDDLTIGAFTVLRDDSFIAAGTDRNEQGEMRIGFYRSTDRGRSFDRIAALDAAPFHNLFGDGNILELSDGTLVSPVQYMDKCDIAPEELSKMFLGALWIRRAAQYMIRSDDQGRTWQSGMDKHFWSALLNSNLNVFGLGPQGRNPGPGGTFPGCWETNVTQIPTGRVMAVLRYSGPQQPWHHDIAEAWNAGEPDTHGRMFRTVVLSDSDDGGVTWQPMRPVADADGRALLQMNDTNGEVLNLPDGRLLLVFVRRDPNDAMQLMALLSGDNGHSWQPDAYRLQAGFGYPGSLVLDDGTIVTVTGRAVNDNKGTPLIPFDAQVIRWKPRPA